MARQDCSAPVTVASYPNEDAPALVAALKQAHIDIEHEKSALACTLHDDIGGLLVGATMDMGWIANQPRQADTVKVKLARALGLLRAAIDLNRELVERLKPTLLENVGLYSTLRWHMKASCKAASIPYTEQFPASEEPITSEVRIGVFRIFQEALKDVLSQRTPTCLSVKVEVISEILHCHLVDHSSGYITSAEHHGSSETSMHVRAQHVGGTLQWKKTVDGRHLHLRVPVIPSQAPFVQEQSLSREH